MGAASVFPLYARAARVGRVGEGQWEAGEGSYTKRGEGRGASQRGDGGGTHAVRGGVGKRRLGRRGEEGIAHVGERMGRESQAG